MKALKLIFFIMCLSACSKFKLAKSNFENGNVDSVWKKSKISQGSLEIQSKTVKHGKYSAKFILKKGMMESIGNDGKITERVELKEKDIHHAKLNEIHRYRFSFFIPKDFPILNTRLVIGQWKQIGKNSPLLAQRFVNGEFYIIVSNSKGKKVIFRLSKEQSLQLINKWIDVEYQIRFSKNSGFVKAKVDEFKASYSGVLAYPKDQNNIYFKFGLYRDQVKEPMTIFFDDYEHIKIE